MNRHSTLLRAAVIALLLAIGSTRSVWSQASPAGSESIFSSGFNLKFPGGTVERYIQAVREAAGDVNIVLIGADAIVLATELPELELKSVTATAALKLIEGQNAHVENRWQHIAVDTIVASGSANIFRIRAVDAGFVDDGFAPDHTPETHVFSITDLSVADLTPEAVLTAVEVAMESGGDPQDPFNMRFHDETNLIIASGAPTRLSIISQVLDELRAGVSRKQNDMVRQLEIMLQAAHDRVDQTQARLLDIQRQGEDVQRQATEFHQRYDMAQRQMEDLRTENAHLQQKLLECESMIRDLQARIDKSNG